MMSTHSSLKLIGKVAVITGGSSGIGLATAKRFVQEGAHVFIIGRRQSELDKAKSEIGKNITTMQGDVASINDLDRLYSSIAKEKGRVDIVMANAAFVELQSFHDATPEHFDRTFATNTRAAFFTVQKALPLMQSGGSVILVAASGHLKGSPGRSTYAASKAAIRSLARTLALELAGRKIRANTLTPGPTDTPILEQLSLNKGDVEKFINNFKSKIPLGRLGNSDEIANAALFLASEDSSYITGIDLVVDGGLTQV